MASPRIEKPITHLAKSLTIKSPKHTSTKYNCFSVSSMVKYATTMKSSAAAESTVHSGRSNLKSSEFQSKDIVSSRFKRNLRQKNQTLMNWGKSEHLINVEVDTNKDKSPEG